MVISLVVYCAQTQYINFFLKEVNTSGWMGENQLPDKLNLMLCNFQTEIQHRHTAYRSIAFSWWT